MTKEFEYMLRLFVNGSIGKKTEPDENVNIDTLLKVAADNNVYYSILHSLLLSDNILDVEAREKNKQILKIAQLASYVRNLRFAEIFKSFEAAQIPYVLLKGYSAAVYYADPYSRISSDTDVLISKCDEKRAIKLLLGKGFTVDKLQTKEDKHCELIHPELGVLELHFELYNERTAFLWFGDYAEKTSLKRNYSALNDVETLPVEEFSINIQSSNERIEFLFLHSLTHFIAGGTSIRTIMDFFLTYIRDKKINYEMFYKKIRDLGFTRYFNSIMAVIERFLCFDDIDVPYYKNPGDEFVDAILKDMEVGKWLGYGNEFYDEIRNASFEKKEIKDFGKGRKIMKNFKKIFPEVRALKNNYSYALKYPVLLPVAWFHRLLRFLFGESKYKNSKIDNCNRIELLKQFDLL